MFKKTLLLSLFTLTFSFQSFAQEAIAEFSDKSVIVLVKLKEKIGKERAIKQKFYPLFKNLKAKSFSSSKGHFLIQDLDLSFKILSVVAKRKIAQYDFMVRIDLNEKLTKDQTKTLLALRDTLIASTDDFMISLTNNTQFHRVKTNENKDVAMAFINRWHPAMSYEAAQKYWIENHGPLVIQVGLPPVVKSYTQVHVNLEARGDVFDKRIQGLSFETITGQTAFVTYFVKNPSVRELNKRLLEDEVNFTPPPELFAFTRLPL